MGVSWNIHQRGLRLIFMRVLLATLIAILFASFLLGQSGQVNGTIRGVVTDPSGAAVANASIQVHNLETGFERNATTNTRGEYEVPLLPVGTYKIDVSAAGFAAFQQSGLRVELAKASGLDLVLQVGTTQQSMAVNADASILNTLSFDVSGNLNQKSMENMPVTSRNTFNLALLVPGLNGSRDDEFGNPTFAFGGMQRKGFLVDGIDNTQRGGPGRLGIFSPETVQEVKVLSNSMAAEYGRTVGGMISMITRGGTNTTHGEVLVLERRPFFIARPSLASGKPFQQWTTYNGNIGGAIKKDKLFYFVSGEYEPEDGARPITITPANAAALGIPASELGSAPFAQRFQTYLGRIDYQFNANNNVYYRYSNFVTPSKYNTSGGLSPKSAGNNFDDRDDTFASQWTSILNGNSINELRFGFLRREFKRPPVSGNIDPIIAISGVATLGSNTSAGQYYNEQQFNFIDNFTHRAGRHEIKMGVDVDTIRVISGDRLLLQYSFTNLQQYLNTINHVINPATGKVYNYTQLTQQFGDNTAQHRTTPINLFIQDDYHITPKFTLSYGLRWEYRVFPALQNNAPLAISQSIRKDFKDFAPRFGFAWQASKKTVVRGGYGIFYDTLNLRLISLADRQNGTRVLSYVISGTDPAAPVYPASFTAPNATFGVKPSITGFSQDFRTQYAHQANLQVERELVHDLSVTVGVQWFGGHRMPLLLDTNLGAPVSYLADGRPVFSSANRPNPNYNQIFAISSVGNSVYYGGFVALNKRFSRSFQFTTSYTLGYAFNNNDSVGDSWQQRHRFQQLPPGLEFFIQRSAASFCGARSMAAHGPL